MMDQQAGARPKESPAFKLHLRATILAGLAILACVAAAARDSAVIVNSGSTNTLGYSITVWSDGKATVSLQPRGGAPGTPKPFTVPTTTTTRFFSDLAAARKANVSSGGPCMKSASFGTSTHITWQGWVSPDLDCPPSGSSGDALVHDVGAIRAAAGISVLPLRQAPTP
jgi:hypothetical protein